MKRSLADQLGNGDPLFALAVIRSSQCGEFSIRASIGNYLRKSGNNDRNQRLTAYTGPSGNRSFQQSKNIGKTNSNDTNTRLINEQKIRRRTELNL